MDSNRISFRPLAKNDLKTLFNWLNRPHLRHHYQPTPISAEEIREKFTPRLDPSHPVRSHIALLDGHPVGYIQSYLIRDDKDFAAAAGQQEGVVIDLFIGNVANLGRGIGKSMLRAYTQTIIPILFPHERVCLICHAATNKPALHCSVAAGFTPLRDIIEEGKASTTLALQLDSFIPSKSA